MDEYDIEEAFAAIEDELIASMIRNMKRHRIEEVTEKKEWAMWQTMQLESLERYKKKNQKTFSGQFSDLNDKIGNLIRKASEKGYMDQEIEILEAIRNGFQGAKRASAGMTAEFFKLNERKLEALIQATTSDMEKAETAILRRANDQYRKAIYNTQVYANSGAGTYEKAVDMATKDMTSSGLKCVQYSNGAMHTLKDYADMAIRTASKRAYLQGEGTKRQEWGISTVIMNKRGNPCPKCLPFVGKVLIDDVWSGGSRKDGTYPLMSYAISQGLYHPRCKDSHTTYFPGISTADDTWTKKELKAIGLSNKKEARQQYAERQQEKYERLSKYSLDEGNQKRYKAKYEQWKRVKSGTGDMSLEEHAESEELLRKTTAYDITDDWIKTATPGDGTVTYSKGYSVSKHKAEIDTAKWIHDNLGGDITLLTEAEEYGKKMPDYLWHESYWELKDTTTEKAADSALRSALKQIKENPGGVILNYKDNPFSEKELSRIIDSRVRRGCDFDVNVLIISKNKLFKVYRYKKMRR